MTDPATGCTDVILGIVLFALQPSLHDAHASLQLSRLCATLWLCGDALLMEASKG